MTVFEALAGEANPVTNQSEMGKWGDWANAAPRLLQSVQIIPAYMK